MQKFVYCTPFEESPDTPRKYLYFCYEGGYWTSTERAPISDAHTGVLIYDEIYPGKLNRLDSMDFRIFLKVLNASHLLVKNPLNLDRAHATVFLDRISELHRLFMTAGPHPPVYMINLPELSLLGPQIDQYVEKTNSELPTHLERLTRLLERNTTYFYSLTKMPYQGSDLEDIIHRSGRFIYGGFMMPMFSLSELAPNDGDLELIAATLAHGTSVADHLKLLPRERLVRVYNRMASLATN